MAMVVVDDMDVAVVNALIKARHKKREAITVCACGCGQEIPALTMQGKPRRWAPGHHRRSYTVGRHRLQRLMVTDEELTILTEAARKSGMKTMTYLRDLVGRALVNDGHLREDARVGPRRVFK